MNDIQPYQFEPEGPDKMIQNGSEINAQEKLSAKSV